jgi:hypothetical protein
MLPTQYCYSGISNIAKNGKEWILSIQRSYPTHVTILFLLEVFLPVLFDYRMECEAKLAIAVVILNNRHKNGKLFSKNVFTRSLKWFLAVSACNSMSFLVQTNLLIQTATLGNEFM